MSKVKKAKLAPASKSVGFSADRHTQGVQAAGRDPQRTRVSKACERCRLKKIKVRSRVHPRQFAEALMLTGRPAQCDGQLPCQKCRNNGHVCTPGFRKRTVHVEYKQVPKRHVMSVWGGVYVEFLETTHLALIGSVHKLFCMIQKNQQWHLGAPELNDRGELVIHDIAKKLGCIGPNGEIDLPIEYQLPTTAAGMARLAAHPERQQYQDVDEAEHDDYKEADSLTDGHMDQGSPSPESFPSIEAELGHGRRAFARYSTPVTHSPKSLYSVDDSEYSHSGSEAANPCDTSSPYVPSMAGYSNSSPSQLGMAAAPEEIVFFLQQDGLTLDDVGEMNWGLDQFECNATKAVTDTSTISNFGMTMGVEDRMVLPEYNDHSTWLSQTLSRWRREGSRVPVEA
ncbi:c6 transcription factor [Trichoderma cornu-damae]|uniref:C6 transcription factor n=1 Tax=Trichoderma cornu-damae TaxID=654480 RepID=A0A9P8QU39_9HYPO|nr:c6 transcription factor [Trichoderma cornu-damae]